MELQNTHVIVTQNKCKTDFASAQKNCVITDFQCTGAQNRRQDVQGEKCTSLPKQQQSSSPPIYGRYWFDQKGSWAPHSWHIIWPNFTAPMVTARRGTDFLPKDIPRALLNKPPTSSKMMQMQVLLAFICGSSAGHNIVHTKTRMTVKLATTY